MMVKSDELLLSKDVLPVQLGAGKENKTAEWNPSVVRHI
jgi:hypothetical protein